MEDNHVQMLSGSKFFVSESSAFHAFQSSKQDSAKNHVLASNQGHKFVGDASVVDAENCSGGGDGAQMETQLEEKLPSSSGVVDFRYAVPHLNETAPEPESSGDDDKGFTFSNVCSLMADLEVVVKIILELVIKASEAAVQVKILNLV